VLINAVALSYLKATKMFQRTSFTHQQPRVALYQRYDAVLCKHYDVVSFCLFVLKRYDIVLSCVMTLLPAN